jgi:uncharacterized integral membrane protein (TIGR00697 family)
MRLSPLFLVIAALFVVALLTANIVAVKLVSIAGFVLPAAIIVFPLSYIIGDVLTEVYGFRAARSVIWLGFCCNCVFVLFAWLAGLLPAAPDWDGQTAYQRILGYAPRLLVASFSGYLVGEFSNAFIMARAKLLTHGRWLWSRTIGSTIVGEGLDSVVFISIAFAGAVPAGVLREMMLTQWIAKVIYETAATPLTYAAVGFLKRKEKLDAYDDSRNLNLLALFR